MFFTAKQVFAEAQSCNQGRNLCKKAIQVFQKQYYFIHHMKLRRPP